VAANTRQLAEITQILVDTAAMLSMRGSELLKKLIDELPPVDEPTPLTATVGEDTTDTTRMTALLAWDNSGTGNHVTIDWGAPDATDDDEPATGTATYQYDAAGTYSIDVTDLEDDMRTVSVDVTVPFTVTGT
jgi:hypothetical protein